MLWYDVRDRVALSSVLQFPRDPRALWPLEDGADVRLVLRQRPVVEIWGVLDVARRAIGVELHIKHPLGDNAALTLAGAAGVLNGVLKIEEHARTRAGVTLVYQDRAAFQQVGIALER